MQVESKPVAVIMGSQSDWQTLQAACDLLTQLQVGFHVEVISAHRTPDKLMQFADQAQSRGFKVIIAGAGGAAHLPGMVAAKTPVPVLGVPVQSHALNGLDSLLSIVQMPKGIAVGTLAIGSSGAFNAGLFACQILALNDAALAGRVDQFRRQQTDAVLQHPDPACMTRIWVLGAGQLGAMLQHAGQPLAIDVRPVDIDAQQLPSLATDDIVTAEREQWPDTQVTRLLSQHPRFINAQVFAKLADRLTQKQLLDHLQLATAPWQSFSEDINLKDLHHTLGERVLLKRRCGGYDGRGQLWLHHNEVAQINEWRNHAIAEARINFDEEISLIGARDAAGNQIYYPLTLNLHVDGILMASIAPLPRLNIWQQQAQQMLSKLLTHLNYVGVMAMECFRVGEKLLINELAPRVHNSGHWTQAGSSLNQFEAHLRAITGLPLSEPANKNLTVMINLVGVERNNDWLSISGAQLYWYNKIVRPGRKVGHINICAEDAQQMIERLQYLKAHLPDQYAAVITWATQQLAS